MTQALLIIKLALALIGSVQHYTALQAHPMVGIAKHYQIGTMQRVARYRGLYGTRTDTTGYASVPDCGRIGQVVSASFRNPHSLVWSGFERLLVVDCSQDVDRPRHLAEGLLVETDYATADHDGWAWDGSKGEGRTAVKVYRFSK